MKLPKEWLKDCVENHAECQARHESQLPTRIISIDPESGKPRLCIPAQSTKGRYVTLSHCWGNFSPLKTEMATLQARMNGITIPEMPKTFQHAIRVTQLLGFQYLWIDSLCIIQDSKKDWDLESSRMQEVYENATLNIAADFARDSTEGLWTGKRLLSSSQAVWNSKNGDCVYARSAYNDLDTSGLSHVPFQSTGSEYVLNTRAWVLQERLLSSRILHFAEHEMAWECNSCCRCECKISPRKSTAKSYLSIFEDPTLSTDRKLDAWYELIRRYSTLKLTYESDKLPALAGLASKAAKSLHKTYCAGLWKEDLPYGLLWVIRDSRRSTRLRTRVPSWSWASIQGKPYQTRHLFPSSGWSTVRATFESRIMEIYTDYGGGSVYGSLQLGIISIRGKKAPVTFDTEHRVVMETSESTLKTEGDKVRPDVNDWSEFHECDLSLFLLFICDEISTEFGERRFYAMALILRPGEIRSRRSPRTFCYKRIGVYQYWRQENNSIFLNRFQEEEICLI